MRQFDARSPRQGRNAHPRMSMPRIAVRHRCVIPNDCSPHQPPQIFLPPNFCWIPSPARPNLQFVKPVPRSAGRNVKQATRFAEKSERARKSSLFNPFWFLRQSARSSFSVRSPEVQNVKLGTRFAEKSERVRKSNSFETFRFLRQGPVSTCTFSVRSTEVQNVKLGTRFAEK